MKLCDLHTHSNFSDGSYTPTEIVNEACRIGLSAIALCDHNTVLGLPEFARVAASSGIDFASGCEFSVDYNGKELHILGLFIDPEHFERISTTLAEFAAHKEASNVELFAALNKAGYDIDLDTVKAKTAAGQVNRAHIAAELTEKGYTASVKEAFSTLLSKKRGFYKEPKRLDAFDAIELIKSSGAIAVLAHPFLNLDEDGLRAFLPKAKSFGLDAMEVEYSLFNSDETAKAKALADEFSLLRSGGSDFHGSVKPDIFLGVGKGDLRIPYEYFEDLRAAKG